MKRFFVTFGVATPFKAHYLEVLAETEADARYSMIYQFKTWANIYRAEEDEDFEMATKYGLKKLATITVTPEEASDYREYVKYSIC